MASQVIICSLNLVFTLHHDACRGASIVSIKDFGCFVEVRPGKQGLLHLSQLALEYVQSPYDLFEEGDTVDVKVMEIKNNRISLSRFVFLRGVSLRWSIPHESSVWHISYVESCFLWGCFYTS